ncbi:MAG: hypothetical protein FD156_32 [Nitrospirae bacterium]|nr:MAG: hypothetical protein FD156_32 [Nitrospirota bacterium]
MPKGFRPSIFVSSTCFDLGQLRADLKQFIESLGLDPVLSDFNSFPINPSYDTIRNCRETVKNRADIFILIVGGRYGAIADNGKSVTNLEYIEAKAKGTPIYVFVAKNIINILPVWRKNKEADFSEVVDNNKLFEFVELLRDTKDNWVFSFESAQEICETLKHQFAYLFMDCLDLRAKIMPGILDDKALADISPKALQILIERPRGWEYRFFAEVLKDYIEKYEDIRRDLLYGVSYGQRTALKDHLEVADWVSQHLSLILNTLTSSTTLLNEGLPVAFGAPGQPGDAKHIHYIAKRFTDGYKRLIEWRLEFLTLNVDDAFSRLLELTSLMATNAIKEIEDYATYIHKETNHIFDNIDQYKEGTEIKLTLTLTAPDTSEISKELERVRRNFL